MTATATELATTAGLGTTALADSIVGNVVLIGFALVGLLAAAALLGSARVLRAERRDPLNARHYINF
ncbi:MAG: hypothetical protein JWR33_303 [Naasia sp.]|jgi:hypothetical protein|uniref:hypothetical protein n=1 Tax=Naasia sp. TaxID=2546198 RepID=UPI00261F938B|nr:hypothetical protein [Naasia sp.]MCU1569562.1 hypothetical protein [Naasia sp.]